MTSIYPASFNFCICTLRLPAVAFVFSLRKVNSASFTLMSSDMTANLNCECNMGSRSLNTLDNSFLMYFIEFFIGDMPGNDITTQDSKGMKQHDPLKTLPHDHRHHIVRKSVQFPGVNKLVNK